jgi:hypothetical protein
MSHKNLTAYNGYEIFYDKNEMEKYRQNKLNDCEKNLKFINSFFKEKINILELGSGNSKLLYNLNLKNLLNFGYGFEISEDRFNFAENWRRDLNIENVKNICDNFLNLKKYNFSNIDLCYMSDLSFQFCEPISEGFEIKLLKDVYETLKKNGKIIIELDGCKKILDSIKMGGKIWDEFDYPDPWQYSLWDCKFDDLNNFLTWDKTFISRDENKKSNSSVILKIYNKEQIENLLLSVGFKNINFFQDWELGEFNCDGTEFIIIAEK